MRVASEMLSLMSVIAFTIGIIWLVVQAFRKSIWWGLGVMLLLPIAVFVFPFLQGKRSLRPVLLIISSILLFIAFAAAQQSVVYYGLWVQGGPADRRGLRDLSYVGT